MSDDRPEGIQWDAATPDQGIYGLTSAAAWVEGGMLNLRLGSEERPLVVLQAPIRPAERPALDVADADALAMALADSRPKNKHGQLCPVWTRRNVSRGRHAKINECDCWILADARFDVQTVLLATRLAREETP